MEETTGARPAHRRVRRLLAGTLVLTIGVIAGPTLVASAAATPSLTLSVQKGAHIKVAWQFDALATRTGSAIEIHRSVDAGAFVRIKVANKPSPKGSFTDKNVPTGLLTYKARLVVPAGTQPFGTEASIQVGSTTTTTTTTTTPPSSTGGELLQAHHAGRSGTTWDEIVVESISSAPDGDVLVAGRYLRHFSVGNVTFGAGEVGPSSDYDGFAARYTSTGALRTLERFVEPGLNAITDAAIDANGDLVAAGYRPGSGNLATVVYKISTTSTSPTRNWTAVTDAGDGATDLVIGPDGSVVVASAPGIVHKYDAAGNAAPWTITGKRAKSVAFAGTDIVIAGTNGNNAFVARHSAANGANVWSKDITGSGTEDASRVAVVPGNGEIVVGGSFSGSFTPVAGESLPSNQGSPDVFVVRYTGSGAYLGGNPFGASGAGVMTLKDLEVDSAGNLVFSGLALDPVDFDGPEGNPALAGVGGQDGFVVRLRPDGTHAWSKRFKGLDATYAHNISVAMLPAGQVAVGGSFAGRLDVAGQTLPNALEAAGTKSYDGYVARFTP